MATPVRHVRIPQVRWDAADAKARLQGTNRAEAINALLDAWLAGDHLLEAIVASWPTSSGTSQPSGQVPSSASL